MELEGKVAIVTGAGQGIGRAVAEALAGAGADIAVVDLDVSGARVFGRFFGDDSTAVVILLDSGRVRGGDNEAEPTAFRELARHEQARGEVATDDLTRPDKLFRADGFAIAEPAHVAPERDAGAVRQDFVEVGGKVCVRCIK